MQQQSTIPPTDSPARNKPAVESSPLPVSSPTNDAGSFSFVSGLLNPRSIRLHIQSVEREVDLPKDTHEFGPRYLHPDIFRVWSKCYGWDRATLNPMYIDSYGLVGIRGPEHSIFRPETDTIVCNVGSTATLAFPNTHQLFYAVVKGGVCTLQCSTGNVNNEYVITPEFVTVLDAATGKYLSAFRVWGNVPKMLFTHYHGSNAEIEYTRFMYETEFLSLNRTEQSNVTENY